MDEVQQNLTNWGNSLFDKIPVAGLLARNAVAYKWKATFRVWMLHELTFWRQHDLMVQSYALHQQGHVLGARILLRSGFETTAILTYLNILMQQVLDGTLDFHLFGEKTSLLLLGARNDDEMPVAINILTVLEKCDKRYPGLMKLYANLSESAHPNYQGLMRGYSRTDYEEYETTFVNRWMELHGGRHLDGMALCMSTFHHEYDTIWPAIMDQLENWISANDAALEATKENGGHAE